jgi:hypothetical protein
MMNRGGYEGNTFGLIQNVRLEHPAHPGHPGNFTHLGMDYVCVCMCVYGLKSDMKYSGGIPL